MSKYLWLFILTLLASCSNPDAENRHLTHAYKDGNIDLVILPSKPVQGIELKTFTADTAANKREQGIRTRFSVHIHKDILNQIHEDGFDALVCDISCKGATGKQYSYLNTYMPELSGILMYPDKHVIFSHETTRTLEIDIPFRKLELKPALQDLTISFIVYPIKFSHDTDRVETKHIERIGSNALYAQNYTVRVYTPVLTQQTISIKYLKISTKHKSGSSYDFALGGTGLPDPYWQLWCGDELIYFSTPVKNSLSIRALQTSSQFYTTSMDVLTIKFLDYDNGPFNRDDLIETIEGTSAELKALKKYQGNNISTATITVNQK